MAILEQEKAVAAQASAAADASVAALDAQIRANAAVIPQQEQRAAALRQQITAVQPMLAPAGWMPGLQPLRAQPLTSRRWVRRRWSCRSSCAIRRTLGRAPPIGREPAMRRAGGQQPASTISAAKWRSWMRGSPPYP